MADNNNLFSLIYQLILKQLNLLLKEHLFMTIERVFNTTTNQSLQNIIYVFIELQVDSFIKKATQNISLNESEVNAA